MSEALDSLLRNPKVWRGFRPVDDGRAEGLPTGYPALDRHLPGGGWPGNALTEILIEDYGTGELALLMPALARLGSETHRDGDEDKGWIAWIAPPFQPYPPALLQWGLDLSRFLVMHPRQGGELLWAAEQSLSSGNCVAVLLWPRSLGDAESRRLQLAAEAGESRAIAFRPSRVATRSSAAALRLRLVAGERGTGVEILKSRGGRPLYVPDVIGFGPAPYHAG